MNTRFVVNSLLFAVPLAIAATGVALLAMRARAVIGPPPDPTPPPPTITAPRGPLPDGPVAFEEWVRFRGEDYSMVGCGFLLALPDGFPVGVTTAHSGIPGDPRHVLESIQLRSVRPSDYALEFDTLYGPPGRARTGGNLTVDYILLQPPGPVDPHYVLSPDPRGLPQPGERVSLYKCVGGEAGRQHVLQGTVQSADAVSVWVLVDEPVTFADWSGSGSPLLSQHTGQVVGMLIAGTLRGRSLLLGMHPIGSLVQKIRNAEQFPRMADYRTGAPTADRTGTATSVPGAPTAATTSGLPARHTATATGLASTTSSPTRDEPLDVTLTTDARRYPAGAVVLELMLTNQSPDVIYLPICGPWEVIHAADPDRPAWAVQCEVDYLGHRVEAGASFTDTLSANLEAAADYQVRTTAFGDCRLDEPKRISPSETTYGDFGDCATRQRVVSRPFEVH